MERARQDWHDIWRVAHDEIIGTSEPWISRDRLAIAAHLEATVRTIEAQTGLTSRSVFDHYGSGYASYVDAWFYEAEDAFRVSDGNGYFGVFVLLSRLTNVFALGEGVKVWSESTYAGSGYMPSVEGVDHFTVAGLVPFAEAITRILTELGMRRLRREDLSAELPFDEVATLLSDDLTIFDAYFHWVD